LCKLLVTDNQTNVESSDTYTPVQTWHLPDNIMHNGERKKGTTIVLFGVQVILIVIASLSLYLSSKCIDQSPTSLLDVQLTKLNARDRCTILNNEEKEKYFKIRFTEEIQNLVNGHETEYVKQIQTIQAQKMDEQLVNQRRKMEDEFAVKISSMEQMICQRATNNVDNKSKNCENDNNSVLFPSDRVGKYIVAMARVPRESFKSTFSSQFGGPHLDSYPGVKDLMLVYGSDDTRPDNFKALYGISKSSVDDNNNGMNTIPFIDDADKATENCDQLHVVFTATETSNLRQCMAIVPNHESFHVHQLTRPSEFADEKRLDVIVNRTAPLQFVSRYHRLNVPEPLYPAPRFDKETKPFFDSLRNYLRVVDTVLDELRVILSKIAINNQVVVMLCNHGQSVLLSNFICSAKARNLELSNVIVFTTDQETTDLVTALGLTAYYDQGVSKCTSTYYSLFVNRSSISMLRC
jgi:hypothetical protein